MNGILLTIFCAISASVTYANMGKDQIKETDEVKAKVESLLVSDTSSRTEKFRLRRQKGDSAGRI